MDENPQKLLRLFAALPVPDPFQQQLAKLPRTGVEGQWLDPSDYHITLRFLGDLEAAMLPDIEAALGRVRRPVFGVEAKGIGAFRTPRQTVLWARLESTRKLTALAGEINEALLPLGFEMPNKPFTPHITLARLKTPHGLAQFESRCAATVRHSWQAQSFALYQSSAPDACGSRYRQIASYDLWVKP